LVLVSQKSLRRSDRLDVCLAIVSLWEAVRVAQRLAIAGQRPVAQVWPEGGEVPGGGAAESFAVSIEIGGEQGDGLVVQGAAEPAEVGRGMCADLCRHTPVGVHGAQ